MSGEINVVCLKWGVLYGPEYVNTLYAMVQRHLSLPFRFVCFTENPQGLRAEIDIQPLPDFDEPPWEYARYCSAWRKLALFRPGLANLKGKVLFLDLDLVILDSLDDFFTELEFKASNQVWMQENWYQPGLGQASAMLFEAGGPESLLTRYETNPLAVHKVYRTEQEYISEALGSDCRFFPDGWCLSFKKHVMPQGFRKFLDRENRQPDAARILVFHGRPNPPDAIAGHWGKSIAWYKRWLKPIYPTPWLSRYWRE